MDEEKKPPAEGKSEESADLKPPETVKDDNSSASSEVKTEEVAEAKAEEVDSAVEELKKEVEPSDDNIADKEAEKPDEPAEKTESSEESEPAEKAEEKSDSVSDDKSPEKTAADNEVKVEDIGNEKPAEPANDDKQKPNNLPKLKEDSLEKPVFGKAGPKFSIGRLLILLVLIVALGGAGAGAYFYLQMREDQNSTQTQPSIASYEECVAAGYPIMESFPEQCAVTGGETFTRQVDEALLGEFVDYENSEFGFSLQYPEAWGVVEDAVTDNSELNSEEATGKLLEMLFEEQKELGIAIRIYSATSNYSPVFSSDSDAQLLAAGYNKSGDTYYAGTNQEFELPEAMEKGISGAIFWVEPANTSQNEVSNYHYVFNTKTGGLVISTNDQSKLELLERIAQSVEIL